MAAVFMITTSTVVIDPYGHRPALGRIYRVLTGGGASLRKLFYQLVYRGISRVVFLISVYIPIDNIGGNPLVGAAMP